MAEGFLTDRKFDVIHNVHVIHWIKDPVNTLKKLESFLLDGGLNITVLQSERGKKILQFVVSGKMTDDQFRQAIPAVISIASIESEKYLIQEPFAFIMNAR